MDYIRQILEFTPANRQEKNDKRVILDYIDRFPDILHRNNEFAHITSSGFIMNPALDKVLMVHHNIRQTWSWTGGHVDGETDFLLVALREAREETGVCRLIPLAQAIVSLDILPVRGHVRKGKYVCTHLHLSVAYLLTAGEEEELTVNHDETSGVQWFGVDAFNEDNFSSHDVYLYGKLIERAKSLGLPTIAAP